jgi:PAS domain S-box-containing protein
MKGKSNKYIVSKLESSALPSDFTQMKKLLDSSLDLICSIDRDGLFIHLNAACLRLLGYGPEELQGKPFMDYVVAEDMDRTRKVVNTIHQGVNTTNFENHFRCKDGNIVPLVWSARWDFEEETMYCVVRDGREKQAAEEVLSQSNERFQLASLYDALYDWSISKNEVYWGFGIYNTFGYRTDEIQMEQWASLLHPDDKDYVISNLKATLEDTTTNQWNTEYRFKKANGNYCHVLERCTIIRDSEGKALRMVGMLQDITLRKEKEAAKLYSEEKYKLLFKESPFPIFIYSLETLQFRDVNETAIRLYGYTHEEFLNMTIADIRPEEDKEQLKQILKTIRQQEKVFYHGRLRHKTKSGTIIYVTVTSHEIKTAAGRKIIATINNITENVRLRSRIVKEKKAAQQEIARTIIGTQEKERNEIGKELHDNVNQLITTAKLYVENSRYYPEQADQFIKKGSDLLQKSINEIRFLSKTLVSPMVSDFGFKETLLELTNSYQDLNVFSIQRKFDFDEDDIAVDIKITLYRILQEALNNTVKYAQATKISILIKYSRNGLKMKYKDNGIGFDTSLHKGGLGLRNIRNRVELYNGTVDILSKLGEGSSITIKFPH